MWRHACCDVIMPTVSSVAACCVRPTAHAAHCQWKSLFTRLKSSSKRKKKINWLNYENVQSLYNMWIIQSYNVNSVSLYSDNIYLHEYWVYTVTKLPVNKSFLLSSFLTRSDHNKLGDWKLKWHLLTVSILLVLNSFIKKRFTTKSTAEAACIASWEFVPPSVRRMHAFKPRTGHKRSLFYGRPM